MHTSALRQKVVQSADNDLAIISKSNVNMLVVVYFKSGIYKLLAGISSSKWKEKKKEVIHTHKTLFSPHINVST